MTDINSITTYQTAVAALQAAISDAIITNYRKGVADGYGEAQRVVAISATHRQLQDEIGERGKQLKSLGGLLDEKLNLVARHEEKIRVSLFKICEQDALIARHEKTHRNLQTEIDRLNDELNRLRNDCRMTACEVVSSKALRHEIDRQSEEICRVNNDRAAMAARLDERNAEIERLKDAATIAGAYQHTEASRTVEVGDVWRSSNGSVRCVSKVVSFPGRIEYQHTHNGKTFSDFAYSPAEFFSNTGRKASVTRNAFSPARHPGEPKEGFMVGDVWTSDGTRTIEKVSDGEIVYRQHKNGENCGCAVLERPDDWPWIERTGASATLVRPC